MNTFLFWWAELLVVGMVVLPITRFVIFQWPLRRQEFLNRITGYSLELYLRRFHRDTLREFSDATLIVIFNRIIGRWLFLVPCVLLILTTLLITGIVVSTALRFGHESYILQYQSWENEEGISIIRDYLETVILGKHLPSVELMPLYPEHIPADEMSYILRPFGRLTARLETISSVSGAYLFVVIFLIRASRSRSLVTSNIMTCSFRLIIAIPLGICVSQVLGSVSGTPVAFALGAFSTPEVIRFLRRIPAKALRDRENETDACTQLLGVSREVADILADEGIVTIQQLACSDPISLSIRTGQSFDFILNLAAQSQSWVFLGKDMKALSTVSLIDCRDIWTVVQKMNNPDKYEKETNSIISTAAKKIEYKELDMKYVFRQIAEDDYTQFLVYVSLPEKSMQSNYFTTSWFRGKYRTRTL